MPKHHIILIICSPILAFVNFQHQRVVVKSGSVAHPAKYKRSANYHGDRDFESVLVFQQEPHGMNGISLHTG